MNEKEQLRKELLEKRNQMPLSVLEEQSREIQKRIFASRAYEKAKRIFLFVSMETEVNTFPVMKKAWEDGKKVFVPVTEPKGKMYFVPLEDGEELYPTKFGVLEPRKSREWEAIPEEGDLFLIPSVGFDQKGNRIGYGGGFYDRYFARTKGYRKIGICFHVQIIEKGMPTGKFDIAVDEWITEREWRKIR